jgi:hypothetical protein
MRSAPPVAQDGDEPDVGQPLVDAPGTICSLSAASARDPLAATGVPAGHSVHSVSQPVLQRGEERLRQVVVPAAGVDVVVLKNVRSLPGGS